MGLVQRTIEQAGIASITLSNIPDLTYAVSVPRLVGIEYPFGQIMGPPGDRERQQTVLLDVLEAAAEMQRPGGIRYLPYKWPGDMNQVRPRIPEPPIAVYLKKNPWQLARLFTRKIPQEP